MKKKESWRAMIHCGLHCCQAHFTRSSRSSSSSISVTGRALLQKKITLIRSTSMLRLQGSNCKQNDCGLQNRPAFEQRGLNTACGSYLMCVASGGMPAAHRAEAVSGGRARWNKPRRSRRAWSRPLPNKPRSARLWRWRRDTHTRAHECTHTGTYFQCSESVFQPIFTMLA